MTTDPRTSRSRKTRIVGSVGVVAVTVGGAGLLAAPAAQAATSPPVVISAPSSVHAGNAFTLKCNIKPTSVGKGWKGALAVVNQKGVRIRASRTIGTNGACTMRVVLFVKGKQKLRVVAKGAQNDIKSSWINVRVR